MRPDQGDAGFLWDMLGAAKGVVELVEGRTCSDFLANRTSQLAVERQVEIIGEAARRVSECFRSGHPEIPWKKIIAQRHVLAHEYGEIRQDLMWEVATGHIPELIAMLQPLIPPAPPAP